MAKYQPCSLKVTSAVCATPGPRTGVVWQDASCSGTGWCQGAASNQTGWTATPCLGFAAQWFHRRAATSEPGHCRAVFAPWSLSLCRCRSGLLPMLRSGSLSLTAGYITFHHWGQGQDPPSNTTACKLEGCCHIMLSPGNITRWPASFPGASIKIQLSANPQRLRLFAFIPWTALSSMLCLQLLSDWLCGAAGLFQPPLNPLTRCWDPVFIALLSLMCIQTLSLHYRNNPFLPFMPQSRNGLFWFCTSRTKHCLSAALGSWKINILPEGLIFRRDGFS